MYTPTTHTQKRLSEKIRFLGVLFKKVLCTNNKFEKSKAVFSNNRVIPEIAKKNVVLCRQEDR